MATFGERLRALRVKHSLRQKDVAERLGISESAYGYYEQGRREPSQEVLIKLAEIFDVSIDYLLTGRTDQNRQNELTPEQIEFLNWVEKNLEGAFFYEFHGTPDEMKEEAMETLKLWWEMEKKRLERRKRNQNKQE